MVSKTAVAIGVLSMLVVIQFMGFVYLYTKPRAAESAQSALNGNSVRYLLISKSLNLARRTLGLNGSSDSAAQKSPINNQNGILNSNKDTGASNSSGQHPIKPPNKHGNTRNAPVQSINDKHSPLRTWKVGTFCEEFLGGTFRDSVPACGDKAQPSDSIKCYGNSHSRHMARCALDNVAIKPSKLAQALFDADYIHFSGKEDSLQILNDKGTSCPKPNAHRVAAYMEDGDYIRLAISTITKGKQIPSSVCEKTIDKTAFFFTAHPFHIYFRFLDYYNLHKALSDYNLNEEEYDIFRVSTGTSEYHYLDFEKALFPNVMHISDLPNVVTCYKRVVLVPKSYASPLFQCKMHWNLKEKCMTCDGKGMSDSDLQTFRKRVVNACSLDDHRHHNDSSLVLISRRPYKRSPKDELRKFERVLTNEGDLMKGIKSQFPSANVTAVHLEELPVCDQVFYANQADVLLAVHGAGLVHLWWLRDDAMAVEMEPHYEAGNPSFKVLSRVTGRKYQSHFIGGGWGTVNVNVKEILNILGSHGNLH